MLGGQCFPAPLDKGSPQFAFNMFLSSMALQVLQDLLTDSLSVFALKGKLVVRPPGASGKRKQSC